MDKETAIEITGGLSSPSKMPGYAYGIPAEDCKVGSHLHKIEGSVCNKCYALKGFYWMPNVKAALKRRLASLGNFLWVEAMVYLIATVPQAHRSHFRWHDSGDVQDLTHLMNIVEVAEMTPEVVHYLPTKEKGVVLGYLRNFGAFPPNLIVRLSGPMVDGLPPEIPHNLTSTVHKKTPPKGFECPAHNQGNKCQTCRACWDPSIPNISYQAH